MSFFFFLVLLIYLPLRNSAPAQLGLYIQDTWLVIVWLVTVWQVRPRGAEEEACREGEGFRFWSSSPCWPQWRLS